jgi:hypothetical protein
MATDAEPHRTRWWLSGAIALAALVAVVLATQLAPDPTARAVQTRSIPWSHVWLDPTPDPSPNASSIRLHGWTIATDLSTLQADCRMYRSQAVSPLSSERSRERDLSFAYTTFYVCGPVPGAKDAYHLVRVSPEASRALARGIRTPESTVGPCVGFLDLPGGFPVVIARTPDISSTRPDHYWVVALPSEPCVPTGSLKIEKLITSILRADLVTAFPQDRVRRAPTLVVHSERKWLSPTYEVRRVEDSQVGQGVARVHSKSHGVAVATRAWGRGLGSRSRAWWVHSVSSSNAARHTHVATLGAGGAEGLGV